MTQYMFMVFVCGVSVFVIALMLAKDNQKSTPQVGDLVYICGTYDPDKGWVKEMKDTAGARGIVWLIEKRGLSVLYHVELENRQTWAYSKEDLLVL